MSKDQQTLDQWMKAINEVILSKELLWNDTDKKGRPRERDLRPLLQSLNLHNDCENKIILRSEKVRIELETFIDPIGRSLKPLQIKHWIEQHLKQTLEITDIKRDELKLHKC